MLQNRKSLSSKLIIAYLSVGIIAVGTIAIFFYLNLKNSLLERTFAQLSAINMLKKSDIEQRMNTKIEEFKLVSKIYKLESKCAGDSLIHHDKSLDSLIKEFKYLEFHLLNNKGSLLYTTHAYQRKINDMEAYLHTNTITEPIHIEFTSKSDTNSFIYLIGPIYNKQEIVGYAAFRENFNPTQEILYLRTGMGKSGESYIVGADHRMRSKSRFIRNTPLEISVNTIAANESLQGNSGSAIIDDYRMVPVLSVFRPISTQGLNWGIITEIDLEEAMIPVSKSAHKLIWICIAVLVLISVMTLWLARKITAPVSYLKHIIEQLAIGKLPEHKMPATTKDEIGQMLEAMDQLIDSLHRTSSFAIKIGQGNFKANYQPLSQYDKVGHALLEMKNELIELNVQKSRLEKRSKKLLLRGQEEERARVAKDLHDGIGPLLTTIKLHLNQDKSSKKVRQIIDDTIIEVRRLSSNLMPSVLIDFGIGPALNNLVKTFSIDNKLKIEYADNTLEDIKLHDDINICIYRIAQESINNIIKHAKATSIKISVTQFEDSIVFFIKDNGKGFNVSNYQYSKTQSNGIRNMEERVKLLDGKFFINSSDKGTEIEVEIPTDHG